jgi:hypothetical protein
VQTCQGTCDNNRFISCLSKLRQILYDDGYDSEETGSADLMKEDLFRMCMKEIDDYLNEKKGVDEMQWIDSQAQVSHIRLGES